MPEYLSWFIYGVLATVGWALLGKITHKFIKRACHDIDKSFVPDGPVIWGYIFPPCVLLIGFIFYTFCTRDDGR